MFHERKVEVLVIALFLLAVGGTTVIGGTMHSKGKTADAIVVSTADTSTETTVAMVSTAPETTISDTTTISETTASTTETSETTETTTEAATTTTTEASVTSRSMTSLDESEETTTVVEEVQTPEEAEEVQEEPAEEVPAESEFEWTGKKLTKKAGILRASESPSGYKETYYNLPMGGCLRSIGYSASDEVVREDGVKTLNGYVMVATPDRAKYPKKSLIPTSLGMGIVVDYCPSGALDIAVTW